jgi:hypothetical protein
VIVRRAPAVLERRFAGEVLLTMQGRHDMDRLDGTAAVTWSLLETLTTTDALVDRLGEIYGAHRIEVEGSVRRFLAELGGRGYVEELDD